jgi:hypothetical protein
MRMMGDFMLWVAIGLQGRSVRLDAPLISWRRHADSVTLNVGIEHSREHLTAYYRALALDGFPEMSEVDRAEGLRNACIWGAIMGGQAPTWPGDRYFLTDLERKFISAGAAGCDLSSPPDWDEVERAGTLYRDLVDATLQLARGRRPAAGEPGPQGTEAAEARLREVGVLADETGAFTAVDESEVRRGLMEAAVIAGAGADPARNRFRIIDLEATALRDHELATLETIGFSGSADATAAELERVRAELSRS